MKQAMLQNGLPQTNALTEEEQWLICFAQACNMIANGHHSLFESMIVANYLRFISITEADTRKDFYLQCVPPRIQHDEAFIAFLDSDLGSAFLPDATISNDTSHEQRLHK